MVAAFYRHRELFFDGSRRTDLYLYFLGHFVADAEVEILLRVIRDGVVYRIARAFDGRRSDDAAKRNDRDVTRTSANVYYHVSARFMDGNARADGREDGLFDDVCFARSRFRRGLDDRAPLRRCDARRNGYHDLRAEEVPLAERFFYVVAKHCLCHAIIRDDAVFHRAVCDYLIRRAAYHFLRLVPDGEYSVVYLRHGDDRWFIEDDAFPGHEYKNRRRA